ncbi:MAG: hypothetical protein FWC23_06795 [Chitinispirillia bacterium]|nr:hypothetical protein [Chitinispirillia bacterium]MCL2268876.1 hypothetical protein [Chitinispirillia bacterium]
MNMWTIDGLKGVVCNWESLDGARAGEFLALMNGRFPPEVFKDHLDKRRRALENIAASKKLLDGAVQSFPDVVGHQSLNSSFEDMAGFGIVFTAGGEGERLRLSLLDRGVPEESLRDFTKATYPLKGFYEDFGALQINLAMVGWICRRYGLDIPVIVTTGPKGSITDRVIPAILKKHNNFGLSHVKVVPQDERLHFTVDEKIAVQLTGGSPYPVTQPDETGGPLMKLKGGSGGVPALQWLADLGCEKLLAVQGTAIYEPKMLAHMSFAAKGHDCVGVGIPRAAFDAKDPFGTFVCIDKDGRRSVRIIEQDIRNDETRSIVNEDTGAYLPFNTGLYAIDCRLLEDNGLPDYATPPKEVLPGLPRSPKIGYAATDILPSAKHPLILTVDPDMYAVIKTAEDLETMSSTAIRFGLREMAASPP